MLLPVGSNRKNELPALGSSEEIALFVQQQDALVAQAKREEAQQVVRHLKLDFVQRIVLLLLVVAVVVVLLIGPLGNPEPLKAALGGGGVAMLTSTLHRLAGVDRGKSE